MGLNRNEILALVVGASLAAAEVSADEAADAGAFVLTIEPEPDSDPGPTDTHILAGDITAGAATLTVSHMAALGDDFTSAAGTFILATPSSADMTDDAQGIWWLVPGMMPPEPSLTLPTLPAGWMYEGWVVDTSGTNPMPISTGRFTDVAAADSDGAGAAGGMEATPPRPGQDFITPARDLTANHMAVISVEPEPDDGPAPFQIKPLGGMIAADTAPTQQNHVNIAADNNPTGTITID